jgi:uncharacterized membrane protein YhiD involved in acid resistance
MKMNFPNAVGFVGAGLAMEVLQFLPGLTAPRETWLMVMGGVLAAVGGSFLAGRAWAWIFPRLVVPLLEFRAHRAAERGSRVPNGDRARV